jgi:hypothetical protein
MPLLRHVYPSLTRDEVLAMEWDELRGYLDLARKVVRRGP